MKWADVTETDWNNWHWQLKNRVSSAEELAQIIHLTPEERVGLNAQDRFRVDITPYFARLIDPVNSNCPIRRQVIPLERELQSFTGMMADSLAEDKQSPVPGLVHRYPDRVLMLVTTHCASYCRYCTRSRMVGDWNKTPNIADFERQLDYLRQNDCIRDVLISGGDPLTLSDTVIHYLLSQLRSIKHIEIIRIGTRIPIFLPQRITFELCSLLQKFHPLWINIHTNHPQEITTEVSQALERLANAGIPLGNQSVLLAGINDNAEIQRKLVHKLVKNRVRPYYLYQCDLVQGAGHFRTSIDRGLDIVKSLQGYTSGYAVPQYVIDAPGGGGKVVISPQNILDKKSENQVFIQTYRGNISIYQEPLEYAAENLKNLA